MNIYTSCIGVQTAFSYWCYTLARFNVVTSGKLPFFIHEYQCMQSFMLVFHGKHFCKVTNLFNTSVVIWRLYMSQGKLTTKEVCEIKRERNNSKFNYNFFLILLWEVQENFVNTELSNSVIFQIITKINNYIYILHNKNKSFDF